MKVNREDMLRELELLPVWRLRSPMAGALPVTTLSEQTVLTQSIALEESIAKIEQVIIAEPAATHVPEVAALPAVDVAEARAEVVTETSVIQERFAPDAAAVPITDVSPEPLLKSPWFLYSPQAGNAASQQLLQNIVRALQFPVEEVALHRQVVSLHQVKADFGVLFGLEAANQFLGADHRELAAVRGQLLTQGDMRYVITHEPRAMLANPQLKKEVWQDLCLLLAQKENGSA